MMSPAPAPDLGGLHPDPSPFVRAQQQQRLWRPRTFNTNFVCAAEHYSSRAFAACCDGPVTSSSVPLESKAAVVPGGVCAAYCYIDSMRMASNARNPHGYSDLYICLVEMSGEDGRSGLETVNGEWFTAKGGTSGNHEHNTNLHNDEEAEALYHSLKHQSPVPIPFDLESDTGELVFPPPHRNDEYEDEMRKRSTVDETLAPEDSGSAGSQKNSTQDPNDTTNSDPKPATPDEAPKDSNGQPVVPDRPTRYSYTYSTTSTPLANSTVTGSGSGTGGAAATPTIETGFSTVPAPSSANASASTLPTQTGTQTEAPNAGQPTGTNAVAPAAGRLKDEKGAWGAGKWGCLVAVLVGGSAVLW